MKLVITPKMEKMIAGETKPPCTGVMRMALSMPASQQPSKQLASVLAGVMLSNSCAQ